MNYSHYISIIALLGIFTVSRAQQFSFSSGSNISSNTIQAHVSVGQLFGSFQLSKPSFQEGIYSVLLNSTEINEDTSLESLIHIFPNPASNILKIESEIFPWLVSNASLYTIQGILMDTYLIVDPQTQISIGHLAAGAYILRLTMPGQQDYMQKIVKTY
jgi:hypothetical protein